MLQDRVRRLSSYDDNQLLSMFERNREGYVKRKEMPMHNRKNINGLNSILGVAENRTRANAFTAEESLF